MVVLLTLVSSVIFAYTSVSSVWVPNQLSNTVFHQQDALGKYEGTIPYAKLSYPLYLNVYHTPFNQLTFEERGTAHGEVRLTMYFAGARIFRVNGAFQYLYAVHGPTPLHYKLSIFHSPVHRSSSVFCLHYSSSSMLQDPLLQLYWDGYCIGAGIR